MKQVLGSTASGTTSPSDPKGGDLFAKEIAVRLKPADQDEHTTRLFARLRLETQTERHFPVLLFELSNKSDPYFLYGLTVGEADFHLLKTEQCLLVDFQAFPAMLVELLNGCLPSGGSSGGGSGVEDNKENNIPSSSSSSRMCAYFSCGVSSGPKGDGPGGEGLLRIVETNQFRQLTHLSLRFRQANHEAIKHYLAQELRGFKQGHLEQANRIRQLEDEAARDRQQMEELRAELRTTREETSALKQSTLAAHQLQLAELTENHVRELGEAQRVSAAERAELEGRLREALELATTKAEGLEREIHELRHSKHTLETETKHRGDRLELSETRLKEEQERVQQLMEDMKALELVKFQGEKEIAEFKVHVKGLQDHLGAKERAVQSHAELAEQAHAHRAGVEETVSTYKAQVQQLEEKFQLSAQEIEKGNQIIEHLQATCRNLKAKLRVKTAALAAQEKGVVELERQIETHKRAEVESKTHLEHITDKHRNSGNEVEVLKEKLDEAHKLLSSNQQVIEYLNRQLNEREVNRFSPLTVSGALPPPPLSSSSASIVAGTPGAYNSTPASWRSGGGAAAEITPLYKFGSIPGSGGLEGGGRATTPGSGGLEGGRAALGAAAYADLPGTKGVASATAHAAGEGPRVLYTPSGSSPLDAHISGVASSSSSLLLGSGRVGYQSPAGGVG